MGKTKNKDGDTLNLVVQVVAVVLGLVVSWLRSDPDRKEKKDKTKKELIPAVRV